MFLTHHNKFGVLLQLLLLIGMSHYAHAKPVAVEIRSNQGDVVSFDYTITPDYDKAIVTIQFMNVRIKLDNKSSKYKNLQYAGKLEVLFLDGNNFEDGVTVELEKDNTLVSGINPITLSEGWEQSNHTIKTKANVFVINDTGEHKLKLNLGQQKGRLRIPIYLAKYEHKSGSNGFLGIGAKPEETTYTVFRECGPLEIDLKPKPKSKESSKSSHGLTIPQEIPGGDSVIDSDEPITDNQQDLEIWELIKSIQPRLEDAASKVDQDYDALAIYKDIESDMKRLESYRSGASPEVQNKIDELKKQYATGLENAKKKIKEISQFDNYALQSLDSLSHRLDSCQWSWSYLFKPFETIEDIEESYNNLSQDVKEKVSAGVWIKISNFKNSINAKSKELKKYLIIKKVIMWLWAIIVAALALFGYSRWKNILEQRKMKSFEEMQQKMARRAEEQAQRRARSYAQNKTRQVIGQAKNQGRKAAQSKAQEVASRVREQKPSSRENPTVGASRANETNDSPPIGRFSSKKNHPPRRPKPGDNGEITI